MVAQSDRGNSKCHIQSALSLQPGAGPSSQLRWYSTAERKVTNMERNNKKKKKKCEGRGAGKGVKQSPILRYVPVGHISLKHRVCWVMGERLQQCLETPVGQSIASEPGCLRSSLPPTARRRIVHAASLHTAPRAAKISPPGTRWNSKQNKLFLTWLYWAFPSSYIKKKERRQKTGGNLEANCRGSGVHIEHCVEPRRSSNAGAVPLNLVSQRGNCHIFHAFVVGSELRTNCMWSH